MTCSDQIRTRVGVGVGEGLYTPLYQHDAHDFLVFWLPFASFPAIRLGLGLEQFLSVDLGLGLGSGLDLHFAVLVSVLQSTFMQLLSACGVRDRESLMLYLI